MKKTVSEPEKDISPFEDPPNPTIRPVMLAMFDVLGFSKRLEGLGVEKLLASYQKLLETTLNKEADRVFGLRDDGTGKRYPVLFALPLRYAYFSDTVLLWVPLEQIFAAPFVSHCATFFCEALNLEFPVRGAISIGEAVMHKPSSIYIGNPIVEAARLESMQKWLGVTFGYSATWPAFLAELDMKLIIEYDAPSKETNSDLLSPVVLDWPRRWRELFKSDLSRKLERLNKKTPHPYYETTQTFVKHSLANQDWFLRPEEELKNNRLRVGKMSNVLKKTTRLD